MRATFQKSSSVHEKNDGIVLEFKGGLGNQMFQYVFYTKLKYEGKKVRCALIRDSREGVPFELDIFPNIQYDEEQYDDFKMRLQRSVNRSLFRKVYNKIFPLTADFVFEDERKDYDDKLFKCDNCVICGYFQSLRYFENIEEQIKKTFVFPEGEEKLSDLANRLKSEQYVSVHIRRGDYLKYPKLYGGICEKQYYDAAIDYFRSKNIDRFIFFSDDMDWVKSNFSIEESIFFDSSDFEDYHDWYDMYLMCLCSHNIIANSTFSWWGAWLNDNKDKIVVAPQKWINTIRNKDFCPNEWVRLGNK